MRLLAALLLCASLSSAQPEPFRVYRADGTAAIFADIVSASKSAEVTFLGETHNDPAAHAVELRLLQEAGTPATALAMEMFERDIQSVLDEYLAGFINEETFTSAARAWQNYKKDYRPLVEYAKEHKIPVVASNAPRRYVNRVTRLGSTSLYTLPEPARSTLAPLPVAPPQPEYAEKFRGEMKAHLPPGPFNVEFALEAQSLWDATMAYSTASFLTAHPGWRVLHVNGSFHTARHAGTAAQLSLYRPGVKALVVTIIPAKAPLAFDAKSMQAEGDFIIVTDSKAIPVK